ncbi:MAG TPA: hypothetical protein VGO11_11850 [Chthoniobacteraceae bacterium]|jgi:hypothetical protein|nr:hypothetical protein [Chthoniobacteraceae bacterium]
MTPSFHPEPPPQNELERLMRKVADDPALHGRMWRMLWASELYTFVPDHPEMRGEFPLENGDQFVFSSYTHPQGEFIAVFTSDAAADWAGEQIPPPKPAIAAMPAEALFKIANNGELWVRVNHGMSGAITLEPDGVAALVRGEFTRLRPGGGPSETLTLVDALAVELPAPLVDAVRRFCDERREALGVYAFFVGSDTSSAIDFNDLRLVVWLRAADTDFYNDLAVMVGKVTPAWLRATCSGVTSDRAETVKFLQVRTPLWPVV